MNFRGNTSITFTNNSGDRGGALALLGLSTLVFEGCTIINFIQNRAKPSVVGGAIFIQDNDYIINFYSDLSTYSHFFKEINGTNCNESEQIAFKFSGNSAVQAGSAIYGGWI